MTPEAQAARAIIEARCDHDGSWYNCDYCLGTERLIAAALRTARQEGLEEAARLHENIDPRCDHEGEHPGAGAMGAVIRYRDAIRARAQEREG